MTKQVARFKKGDKVYMAATHVSSAYTDERGTVYLAMVIERTIDGCGQKQMTFMDNGYDSCFGKCRPVSVKNYFATTDEAFAYLKNLAGIDTTVCKTVFNDQGKEWVQAAKEWKEALQ